MDLSLDDKQLEEVVSNVANTEDGLKLIGHFISESRVFEKGFNGNETDSYNKGRADFGIEIIESLELYAQKAWFTLQEQNVAKKLKEIEENGN